QSATVLAPTAPLIDLSRLTSANAPGAPFLPRGNVVSSSKQGQPGPESFGWSLLTTIGAAQRTSAGTAARALAPACTVTESIEKILEKKPGAVRETFSVTVSLRRKSLLNVIPDGSIPPPFLSP